MMRRIIAVVAIATGTILVGNEVKDLVVIDRRSLRRYRLRKAANRDLKGKMNLWDVPSQELMDIVATDSGTYAPRKRPFSQFRGSDPGTARTSVWADI